jgi:hypothetical protein
MAFTLETTYKRDDIYAQLGGEKETYLPQKNGKIVCGCFNPKENPQAPYIILVRSGEKIEKKAQILSKQEGCIPVFVKQETNQWEYKGNFICIRYSTEPAEIECVGAKKISNRDREDITGILYMRRC